MRGKRWSLAALIGAGTLAGLPAMAADMGIPAPLAAYRSWKTLTGSPQQIPAQLAQLCAPAGPPTSPAASQDPNGPHANRWVMAYANPSAMGTLTNAAIRQFPAGATIAKEKRASADSDHPEGVAFMVKHRAGEFSSSGGWEFLYYPAGKSADYSGCIDCHRSRGKKDYVFGTYGTAAAGMSTAATSTAGTSAAR